MPALSRTRHAGPAAIALLAVTMTGCGSATAAGNTVPAVSGASHTATADGADRR